MLEYVALGILIFAAVTVFYGIIAIHDIPYEISKHRNHPHQDAIHVAGWVSLFTLHVLWPFLWIWATVYREDRGWGFQGQKGSATGSLEEQVDNLRSQLNSLQSRFDQAEKVAQPEPPTLHDTVGNDSANSDSIESDNNDSRINNEQEVK